MKQLSKIVKLVLPTLVFVWGMVCFETSIGIGGMVKAEEVTISQSAIQTHTVTTSMQTSQTQTELATTTSEATTAITDASMIEEISTTTSTSHTEPTTQTQPITTETTTNTPVLVESAVVNPIELYIVYRPFNYESIAVEGKIKWNPYSLKGKMNIYDSQGRPVLRDWGLNRRGSRNPLSVYFLKHGHSDFKPSILSDGTYTVIAEGQTDERDGNQVFYGKMTFIIKNGKYVIPAPPSTQINVYRLYHPALKVHLYSTDVNEKNVLSKNGWTYEGVSWKTETNSGQPVYRLYHQGLRYHFYTKDKNEYDTLGRNGWKQEGIAYRSYGTVKIYRLYHTGLRKHLFTKDANEYMVLAKRGWRQEGVAWYGQP